MITFTELGNAEKDIAANLDEYIRSMYAKLKEQHPNGFDTLEERNKFQKEQLKLAGIVLPLARLGSPVLTMTEDEWDWINVVFARKYD